MYRVLISKDIMFARLQHYSKCVFTGIIFKWFIIIIIFSFFTKHLLQIITVTSEIYYVLIISAEVEWALNCPTNIYVM